MLLGQPSPSTKGLGVSMVKHSHTGQHHPRHQRGDGLDGMVQPLLTKVCVRA